MITLYAAPDRWYPRLSPASRRVAWSEILRSFTTASTYIDTISGKFFLPQKAASRIQQQRQAHAVFATGGPCDSNYRHAHLFFRHTRSFNQSPSRLRRSGGAPPGRSPSCVDAGGIVRPARLVSDRHASIADGFARPPFAHPVGIYELRDRFPLGRGRHHFFPNRSFSAALSSMASTSSRFSRVFSSSSVFSRLDSETSIPPSLAFHL